ncbi:hypothetical protein [Aquitalea aquatilis]|uniref:hypothetical protein n=1 Tax=Aquitalea aquatilis TaxID=1537400 RepID=UPI0010BD7BFE|nr:hypothetical protein [Aquitalea aquatilis]
MDSPLRWAFLFGGNMSPEHYVYVDGLVIPLLAGLEISQTYAVVDGGSSIFRARSGTARKQTNWTKLKTTISGSGWMPAGLAQLDQSIPHELDCIVPRVIASASRMIAIPSYRLDISLCGHAVVGGELVPADVSVSGGVVTISEVVGAQQYQLTYWPRLMGFVTASSSGNPMAASWGWELVFEEK